MWDSWKELTNYLNFTCLLQSGVVSNVYIYICICLARLVSFSPPPLFLTFTTTQQVVSHLKRNEYCIFSLSSGCTGSQHSGISGLASNGLKVESDTNISTIVIGTLTIQYAVKVKSSAYVILPYGSHLESPISSS